MTWTSRRRRIPLQRSGVFVEDDLTDSREEGEV